MSTCYELVIYSVKPNKLNDFNNLHKCVTNQLSKRAGFISSLHELSATKKFTFTDKVVWENKTTALLAYNEFNTFPCKDEFISCIETVYYSGHFLEMPS